MPWYAWAMVASYVISAVASVHMIGLPRTPLTSGSAIFAVAFAALYVWGIVALAH